MWTPDPYDIAARAKLVGETPRISAGVHRPHGRAMVAAIPGNDLTPAGELTSDEYGVLDGLSTTKGEQDLAVSELVREHGLDRLCCHGPRRMSHACMTHHPALEHRHHCVDDGLVRSMTEIGVHELT